jgi:hypothetical protein
VADTGTVGFTDDEAQIILDSYRVDLYRRELAPVPANISGTTQYLTHIVGFKDLETVASGTAYWQGWDANGSAIGTADYSADYQTGIVTFAADTKGSARYLDARSFDLNGAAAHGWREWAAAKASLYKFSADGASYDRNQWFEHCMAMAAHYDRMATTGASSMSVGHMYRSDVNMTPLVWEW